MCKEVEGGVCKLNLHHKDSYGRVKVLIVATTIGLMFKGQDPTCAYVHRAVHVHAYDTTST
jgi:hypothetical protein